MSTEATLLRRAGNALEGSHPELEGAVLEQRVCLDQQTGQHFITIRQGNGETGEILGQINVNLQKGVIESVEILAEATA